MKDDSFVWDILKLAICVITLFLFFYLMSSVWKVHNEALEKMNKSMGIEGYEVIKYTKSCIDNKQFINSGSGITINLDMEGKPIACKVKE